jgi:hypothetical protein
MGLLNENQLKHYIKEAVYKEIKELKKEIERIYIYIQELQESKQNVV